MDTPRSRARAIRAALVGTSLAAITIGAHGLGHGAVPSGAAMFVALLICVTIGAVSAATTSEASRHHALGVIGALLIAQVLGHVVLTFVGEHHHGGGLGLSPSMIAVHATAAVLLGIAITSVEYLYVVCASVLCWWRLFLANAARPAVRARWFAMDDVPAQSVLRCAGLGMRAPPVFARG